MSGFESFPEQDEAKRLLRAALREGPAHAYLFHGPGGVGKRTAALAFAAELLADPGRVARRAHPDLYVLEPLGDEIRIDAVRELRRDLHMRPFEASRRVYLVLGAQHMNPSAADALLKDLEEPPDYAVIVLVADELGPLPPTIVSRCQKVPFRRLSRRAVREVLAARGAEGERLEALARVAGGRLDRAERLLDERAAGRRDELLAVARSVYLDAAFDPLEAGRAVLALARARAAEAGAAAEEAWAGEETAREREQRIKRAAGGAQREEVIDAVELLASWYRDLVVVEAGAGGAAANSDRLAELRADAEARGSAAERAAEICRDVWRLLTGDARNAEPLITLAALFVRLRGTFVRGPAALAGATSP